MTPVIRRATREDIEVFAPDGPRPTTRAYVADLDGDIIGIFGLMFSQGRWLAFCDLKDEARPFKKTIVKTAKMIFREAEELGIKYIYAEANPSEKMAVRWLISLGFDIDPRGKHLYRWTNDRH